MNHARVFLAEDNAVSYPLFVKWLEAAGHQVIASAHTLSKSLAAVRQFGELGINLAIVDGNLDPGASGCRDGKQIAKAITEAGLGIKVVAISGEVETGYGDYQLPKPFDEDDLAIFIAGIP